MPSALKRSKINCFLFILLGKKAFDMFEMIAFMAFMAFKFTKMKVFQLQN